METKSAYIKLLQIIKVVNFGFVRVRGWYELLYLGAGGQALRRFGIERIMSWMMDGLLLAKMTG